MTKKPKQQHEDLGDEFFYIDENGKKADADLHKPMLLHGDIVRGLLPPIFTPAQLDEIRMRKGYGPDWRKEKIKEHSRVIFKKHKAKARKKANA